MALGGDPAVGIERAKFVQQVFGFLQRRRGRRIEEREAARVADAPLREIEHQRRQVGGKDLRLGKGCERCGLRLIPQPVAHAGLGAAGAAAALVDRSARGAHGFEPCERNIRLIARHPRHAGIHDDTNAFNGQRRLGDRGREHHLALALGRRRDGAVLHGGIERAEQRHDLDAGIVDAFTEKILGAADFGGTWQKRQHRAGIGAQR